MDTFSFLGGVKPDNAAFTKTPTNIFDTSHPVIEDHDEESTSIDGNKNAGVNTAATKI